MFTYEALKDEYRTEWDQMIVIRDAATLAQCKQIMAGKSRYLSVQAHSGVAWWAIGIIHAREAGSPPDWKACLANGERVIATGRKTALEPHGRGPWRTFEDSAIDELDHTGLDQINWKNNWAPEHLAFALESFNGWGYRTYHNIPSPYLWGGTSVQRPGKYVRDGHFDSTVIDTQIGGMALLWGLMQIDSSISVGVPMVARADPETLAKKGEQEMFALLNGVGGMFQRGKAT